MISLEIKSFRYIYFFTFKFYNSLEHTHSHMYSCTHKLMHMCTYTYHTELNLNDLIPNVYEQPKQTVCYFLTVSAVFSVGFCCLPQMHTDGQASAASDGMRCN